MLTAEHYITIVFVMFVYYFCRYMYIIYMHPHPPSVHEKQVCAILRCWRLHVMRRNLRSITRIVDGYRSFNTIVDRIPLSKLVVIEELLMQLMLEIDTIPSYNNYELRCLRKGLVKDIHIIFDQIMSS